VNDEGKFVLEIEVHLRVSNRYDNAFELAIALRRFRRQFQKQSFSNFHQKGKIPSVKSRKIFRHDYTSSTPHDYTISTRSTNISTLRSLYSLISNGKCTHNRTLYGSI
jgi:hypothetical protein